MTSHFANQGDTVKVGGDLFKYDPRAGAAPAPAAKEEAKPAKAESPKAEAPKQAAPEAPKQAPAPSAPKPASPAAPKAAVGERTEHRTKMTRIRNRISERLKVSIATIIFSS